MNYIEITFEDLAKFLNEKIKNKCPLCDTEVFEILADNGNSAGLLFLNNNEIFKSKPRHLLANVSLSLTIPISCRNCGNILFFSREVITNWKKEQENKNEA